MRSVAEIFSSYEILDADGRHINGTDKNGPNHRYGDAYQIILDCARLHRNDVKLMMEVGIADGSSLLAWREVFPNALCVGMDIHRSARAEGVGMGFPPDRIEFHLGDATDWNDCRQAAAGRKFDLIVEDATHRIGDTLQTLFYLWPFVRAGGLYVIEEFDSVCSWRDNIAAMWPSAKVVDTRGPFGGVEPLVVLGKPL